MRVTALRYAGKEAAHPSSPASPPPPSPGPGAASKQRTGSCAAAAGSRTGPGNLHRKASQRRRQLVVQPRPLPPLAASRRPASAAPRPAPRPPPRSGAISTGSTTSRMSRGWYSGRPTATAWTVQAALEQRTKIDGSMLDQLRALTLARISSPSPSSASTTSSSNSRPSSGRSRRRRTSRRAMAAKSWRSCSVNACGGGAPGRSSG